MIEKIIIQYLSSALDVPVYAERPETPDESYVLVERTGGSEHNHLLTAMVALQCYAPSLLSASALCGKVTHAMRRFDDLPEISKASLNAAYNFSDTATREYRYQAVYDLVYFDNEEGED